MAGHKIKIDTALFKQLSQAADIAGYSSVQEFIHHILETAIVDLKGNENEEEIRRRLQGLGYLD